MPQKTKLKPAQKPVPKSTRVHRHDSTWYAWVFKLWNYLRVSYRANKPLYIIALVFFIVSFIYQELMLRQYSQYVLDLGMWNRHFWSLAHLDLGPNPIRGFNLFGDHTTFLGALLTPLYMILPHLQFFFAVQSLSVALSIFPLWKLANKYFSRGHSYIWLVVYLAFFGFWSSFNYAFHEVIIAVPIIAWLLWFYSEERWTAVTVSSILLLLVREDMPFYVIALAFCMFVFKKRRVQAVILALVSYVYYVFLTKYFMPHMAGFAYFQNQTALGNTIPAIIKNSLEHPKLFIHTFFAPEAKLELMIGLFASFGFLSLFSLEGLILVAPALIARFLSYQGYRWTFGEHYSATQGPLLFFGALLGCRFICMQYVRLRPKVQVATVQQALVGILVGVAIMAQSSAQLHYATFGKFDSFSFYRLTPIIKSSNKAASLVPNNASVAISSSFPQLTARRDVYIWPGPVTHAITGKMDLYLPDLKPQYIVVSLNLDSAYMGKTPQQLRQIVNGEIKNGYTKIFDQNGAIVLRRT